MESQSVESYAKTITRPWNALFFYVDENGSDAFDWLLVQHPNHTQQEQSDRVRCHVLLVDMNKAKSSVKVDEIFTSNFFDPSAYAIHMSRCGLMGLLVKDTHPSMLEIITSCRELILTGIRLAGVEGVKLFNDLPGNFSLDKK